MIDREKWRIYLTEIIAMLKEMYDALEDQKGEK